MILEIFTDHRVLFSGCIRIDKIQYCQEFLQSFFSDDKAFINRYMKSTPS